MRITTGLQGLAVLLAVPALHAQTTVYKCTGADGSTVYSGQPCKGSNKQVLHLKAPAAPDMHEVARRAEARAQYAARRRADRLARKEVACIEARTYQTRRGTKRRIASYQQQIRNLRNRSVTVRWVNSNLAGATASNGLSEQIAAIQAAISTEKQILAQTGLNARTICAQLHQQARTAGTEQVPFD